MKFWFFRSFLSPFANYLKSIKFYIFLFTKLNHVDFSNNLFIKENSTYSKINDLEKGCFPGQLLVRSNHDHIENLIILLHHSMTKNLIKMIN